MRINKNITKEEFNKLSQLDRIEFRQREDKLDKELNSDLGSWDFLWGVFVLTGFIIILSLLIYNINPQSTIRILSTIPLLIKLTVGSFVLLKIIEIAIIFRRGKEKIKLREEYFDIKVETKPKK